MEVVAASQAAAELSALAGLCAQRRSAKLFRSGRN